MTTAKCKTNWIRETADIHFEQLGYQVGRKSVLLQIVFACKPNVTALQQPAAILTLGASHVGELGTTL